MRIILLAIISWLILICVAVVVVFSVLALLKITKEAVKKIGVSRKEFVIGLIISAICVIVLSFSVFKYFVWKSSKDKIAKSKSIEAPLQKEKPVNQVESQVTPPSKELAPVEMSAEKVEPSVAVPPEKVVSRSEKKGYKEKKQKKLLQTLKPSKAVFTVQVGAFRDFSRAKSLKTRFQKKAYNAYITSLISIEGDKVYKVCIGNFIERKKAETLSEKIRNSEGIQTFVTSLQP
jgi:cell division septation protein DedD